MKTCVLSMVALMLLPGLAQAQVSPKTTAEASPQAPQASPMFPTHILLEGQPVRHPKVVAVHPRRWRTVLLALDRLDVCETSLRECHDESLRAIRRVRRGEGAPAVEVVGETCLGCGGLPPRGGSDGGGGMGLVVPGHGTFPELVVPSRQHIVDQTLEAAEAEWRRGVHDRRGTSEFARILEYIHSGLGWRWVKYERNGKFAWCGGFAAFSLASAGLHRLLRYHAFSSVERLAAFGRYRFYTKWRGSHARLPGGLEVSLEELHAANGGLRLCQSVRVGRELAWEPQPGDVVLMGPESEKHPDGKHIALVREVDLARGELHTVEGNATGTGPDGSRFEGVIHQVRPLPTKSNALRYHVRTLVRVALADCVPGIEIVAR